MAPGKLAGCLTVWWLTGGGEDWLPGRVVGLLPGGVALDDWGRGAEKGKETTKE